MSETGSDSVTDELQAYVPERGFDETDIADIAIIRSDLHSGKASKKRRITYSKDFLVKCFRHPACAKKPPVVPWPKPNLECTTETPRLKSPFAPYPRKKDENGRKAPEDNISLRPHSGNFSSGCAPNLSPAHFPSHNQFNRFSFQHQEEQPPKTFFDRSMSKNNLRFNNNARPELNEKILRDRGMRDPRNERGGGGAGDTNIRGGGGGGNRDSDHLRGGRDNNSRDSRQHNQHNNDRRLWGPDLEDRERNDWTRRRSNNHRDRHNRNHDDSNMPDWFTGGPTSRHDTIELDGFGDDKRCDRTSKHQVQLSENNNQSRSDGAENKSGTISPENSSSNVKEEEARPAEPNQMDLLLEILMDSENHNSGILPNGLFQVQEIEESQTDITTPCSGSRFSRFFHRESEAATPNTIPNEAKEQSHGKEAKPENSENGDKVTVSAGSSGGNPFQALFGSKSDGNANEEKSEFIKGMESELRQILLRGNAKEEQLQQHQPQIKLQHHQQQQQPQIKLHQHQQPQIKHQQQAQQQQQQVQQQQQQQQVQQQQQQQHQQAQQQQQQQAQQQQQQNQDMNAFKKLLEDLVIKGQTTSNPSQTPNETQDVNPLSRIMNSGPPGINPFSNFGLNNSVQARPLQPHNAMVAPPMSVNHVPAHHPLGRFVDHSSRESMLQNQKRSSTPVSDLSFTPTSVMRKMTSEQQQLKSGASNVKEPQINSSAYSGGVLSSASNSSSIFSNLTNVASAPPPPPHLQANPLATFMSQMGQSQPHQHMPPHHQPPHTGIPNPGMYPQRIPYPVMGPPPNSGMGMPVPFNQYMMYQPPLHQRK